MAQVDCCHLLFYDQYVLVQQYVTSDKHLLFYVLFTCDRLISVQFQFTVT